MNHLASLGITRFSSFKNKSPKHSANLRVCTARGLYSISFASVIIFIYSVPCQPLKMLDCMLSLAQWSRLLTSPLLRHVILILRGSRETDEHGWYHRIIFIQCPHLRIIWWECEWTAFPPQPLILGAWLLTDAWPMMAKCDVPTFSWSFSPSATCISQTSSMPCLNKPTSHMRALLRSRFIPLPINQKGPILTNTWPHQYFVPIYHSILKNHPPPFKHHHFQQDSHHSNPPFPAPPFSQGYGQHGHSRSQLGRLQLQPAPKNHGLAVKDVVRTGSEHMHIISIQLYEKYKYVNIYIYNIYILHFSYRN